jgi:predicted transcriptional regulator
MTSSQDVYEIRPRKDRRGFDLIGERLPLGLLWFEGADAMGDAVNYARFFSRSHPAIIRVFDDSGMVAETLELAGDYSQNKQNACCVFPQPTLNVHVNISAPNANQDRRATDRIVTAAPTLTRAQSKHKRHNAKLCPLVIRERIVNALAAGDSKSSIAKTLGVSRNTVSAIAEQEWLKVEQRKVRIVAQSERNATRAAELISEKLETENVPLSTLVPVFAEIVSNDFPVLHGAHLANFCFSRVPVFSSQYSILRRAWHFLRRTA